MVSNSICRGRALKISIGITMLVLLLAGGASSATLTVCQGGCDYTSIQTAINAASNGDTILVAAGIYNENVIVNKSVNLTGAGADVTIVKASGPDSNVFFVSTQNGVNISGFTVTGGTGGIHPLYSAGIILSRTNNTNVSNNNVSNNFYGIYLFSAINTNLSNNHVNSNNYGIYIMLSSKNIITNNTIASNNIYGLSCGYSNNTIYNNFFNNTNNFDTRNTYSNIWNTTKQTGTNIVGGPNL